MVHPGKGINWTPKEIPSLKGKIACVTGSNSGIGFQAALNLSKAGATVVMAVRNTKKGEEAKKEILATNNNVTTADIHVMEMDLSNLNSIKKFASNFIKNFEALDILINNAGVMYPPGKPLTADGFELQFGTNHLGHFALTARLLPALRKQETSRVVTVSSLVAHQGHIDFEDLNFEKRPTAGWQGYAQSKLANILFAKELSRKSERENWGVVSVCAHPGVCNSTEIIKNGPGGNSLHSLIQRSLGNILFPAAEESVIPILYAATANEVKGGKFFGPKRMWEIRDGLAKSKIPGEAMKEDVARKLWNISAKLTETEWLQCKNDEHKLIM